MSLDTRQPPLCTLQGLFDPPCTGPAEVQITDRAGETAWGCVTHASIALACIRGSTIVDHTRDGAAIEAHMSAQGLISDYEFGDEIGPLW